MKNLLITGGAGFIGANFVQYMLNKNRDISIFNLDLLTYAGHLENLTPIQDSPRYQFIQGDICDPALVSRIFKDHEIDTVVHFAAESHVDRSIESPRIFVRTNIEGTLNLLEQAAGTWGENLNDSKQFKFHHVSTDEIYGELTIEEPAFTETNPTKPNSPYAASKASSDHFVRAFGNTYNIPYTISNCSNNYGPYQFPEKLIPLMTMNALAEKPLPIYGDGQQIRDWLFVNDHCVAIDLILENGKRGETYNVGGNTQITNLELVNIICAHLDEKRPRLDNKKYCELITFVKDRPGHDFRYAVDITKINNDLDWQPNYTLKSGLKTTIDWYLDNPTWIEKVMG